ncbi:MAG: hypothetical protein ABIN93_01110 [Ginsengibacter sp.]
MHRRTTTINSSHIRFKLKDGHCKIAGGHNPTFNIMATIPNGILGVFIGRAGNLSGYMRNGKNIIRATRKRAGTIEITPKRLA